MININDRFWVGDSKELRTYNELPTQLKIQTLEEFNESLKSGIGEPLLYYPEVMGFKWKHRPLSELMTVLGDKTQTLRNQWSEIYELCGTIYVEYVVCYDKFEHGTYVDVFNSYQDYLKEVTFPLRFST